MKKYFSCFWVLISYSVTGQNLVPNSSFENAISCPFTTDEINLCVGWFNPTTNTPDYFSECATDSITGPHVPTNIFGFQWARTGKAYAGFATYGRFAPQQREYIAIKLIDSLISGKNYKTDFYVSLADSCKFTTDVIGAYFSKDTTKNNNYFAIKYNPQVSSPKGVFLKDYINWTLISGTFIANGGEQFMTIGNFGDSAHTNVDTTYNRHPNYGAYYYIDDVSVTLDTLESIQNFSNPLSFSIFPNPANGSLTIQTSQSEHLVSITLFNLLGQKVTSSDPPASSIYSIDVGELPKAVYIVQVRDVVTGLTVRQRVVVE